MRTTPLWPYVLVSYTERAAVIRVDVKMLVWWQLREHGRTHEYATEWRRRPNNGDGGHWKLSQGIDIWRKAHHPPSTTLIVYRQPHKYSVSRLNSDVSVVRSYPIHLIALVQAYQENDDFQPSFTVLSNVQRKRIHICDLPVISRHITYPNFFAE